MKLVDESLLAFIGLLAITIVMSMVLRAPVMCTAGCFFGFMIIFPLVRSKK